jgi:hypothetical protein
MLDVPRNRRVLTKALKSHLIPSQVGRGIWDPSVKRGFRTFIDDRAHLLAREFERKAGQRLFDRG